MSAAGSGGGSATSTGWDPGIEALAAYALGPVSGAVVLTVEKEHAEVRYHAALSLVVGLALGLAVAASALLGLVPVLAVLSLPLGALVFFGGVVVWVLLMLQAYRLAHPRIRFLGRLAERLSGWSNGDVGLEEA